MVVQPEFSIDVHAPRGGAICCRLDGIPLAIELVAARQQTKAPTPARQRGTGRSTGSKGGSKGTTHLPIERIRGRHRRR